MLFSKKHAGLLVTPGASADRTHSTLVALENALPEMAVERLTLGTTSINRAARLVAEAVESFATDEGVSTTDIVIGGRSFGGRACSVAVAEGLAVAGLVLLSYPLHPPGKPDKLRVDHFDSIDVPTLFVSGDRDPFGTPDEFAAHVSSISAPTEVAWVSGNHSPKGPAESEVVGIVRAALLEA